MLRYLVDHFRGQLSLARTFWVNFIALAAVLYTAGVMLRDMAAADSRFLVGLLIFLIVNALIYSWQVCGVWRASERALLNHSWFLWVRGVQAIVLISALAFLGQVMGYVHLISEKSPQQQNRGSTPGYVLKLSTDGTVVELNGVIDFGITRELTRLLKEHESISVIGLHSHGGRVSEARGLAMLIARYNLTTYAEGVCSSACTHAYVSGKRRILGPGAKLGFHSYRLDSPYARIFMDPVDEQHNDLALFHNQNIDSNFLERVLDTPNSTMWFPSHEELLAAGVAHEVRALWRPAQPPGPAGTHPFKPADDE